VGCGMNMQHRPLCARRCRVRSPYTFSHRMPRGEKTKDNNNNNNNNNNSNNNNNKKRKNPPVLPPFLTHHHPRKESRLAGWDAVFRIEVSAVVIGGSSGPDGKGNKRKFRG